MATDASAGGTGPCLAGTTQSPARRSRWALEASVKQSLGTGAQLSVSGERATLTLKGVTATALGAWLAQVRANARALPAEARLVRSPATTAATGILWDGVIVLALPPR